MAPAGPRPGAAPRAGDAEGARASLTRIRDIEETHGISDPTVNRWQPELASTLVALGALEEAAAVLAEARQAIDGRSGTDGVGAQLDRAEAELLCALGDLDGALHLLDRAGKVCADVGMRIELGRLTDAEARIAQLVCQGASNRQVAERQHLSVKTVEAALTRIYRKLDVRSRTQLVTLLVPAPTE